MENYMKLKVKALSRNEAFVRCAVAAFCVELDPSVDEVNDVKTAVSEAVTNCVVHGYPNGDGEIEVNADIDDGILHIEIIDNGVGIDDIDEARQPMFTTRPDEERSGMGFTVMETFMDSLEVTHNQPNGLIVRMSKNLSGKN